MAKAGDSFAESDRVHNAAYGPGTIVHVDAQYTTIAFDEHGTKKFVTNMVRLDRTDVPEPEKPVRTRKPRATKASAGKSKSR